MERLPQRNYVRLETATQNSLDELSRHMFTTKSELMRRYIRDGVRREGQEYAACIEQIKLSQRVLASF